MRLPIFAVVLFAICSDPAAARCMRDELWELATQALDPGADQVTIPVLSPGRSKSIWFRSEGGPIAVTALQIAFSDGGTLSPNKEVIARDAVWSDPLAFPGDVARVVTSITLRYRSLRGGAARAALQIWGQQSFPAPPSQC